MARDAPRRGVFGVSPSVGTAPAGRSIPRRIHRSTWRRLDICPDQSRCRRSSTPARIMPRCAILVASRISAGRGLAARSRWGHLRGMCRLGRGIGLCWRVAYCASSARRCFGIITRRMIGAPARTRPRSREITADARCVAARSTSARTGWWVCIGRGVGLWRLISASRWFGDPRALRG